MLEPKKNSEHFCYLNKESIQQDIYREWLIGNGLGSYASGTISGILNKRYHGLFIYSDKPPLSRKLYVSKIEETIEIENQLFLLSSNKWASDNNLFPKGFIHLECFYLDENIPVWVYNCHGTFIEKRIIVPIEQNIVYITYKLLSTNTDKVIKLKCDVFVNNRNFHHLSNLNYINIKSIENGNSIDFLNHQNDFLFEINSNFLTSKIENILYSNYDLQEEFNRGFDHIENHILGSSFYTKLKLNEISEIKISTNKYQEKNNFNSVNSIQEIKKQNQILLQNWKKTTKYTPNWIEQLIYSVNIFIVNRANQKDKKAKSILAGYHWFGDWGRDTMISLPGLCCATEQFDIAKSILENYSHYISEGMLPNRFPDDSEIPDYNTVDATMWFFEAISNYFKLTQDLPFLKEIYSKLENIIEHHLKGTRFHIKCDPNDGLLFAGQEGCQLTWMDAKIGNYVVTPRIGKTIEVNALWYNAIKNMEYFADILNQDNKKYSQLSNLIEQGFERFWNENLGYCYDVIDGPNGNDETLRPNQIIAVSLNYSPLNQYQKRNIIDICGKNLVSFFGVKSLSKNSNDYKNKYIGTPFERDSAYHQGTIWSWLLGNYAIAYYNVTLNAYVAIGFLEPLEKHINEAGIGFISEIFDAESPYKPRGCIAQAWGVAETLRAWKFLSNKL